MRVTCGIWDSVLPGVMLRVVIVHRPEAKEHTQKNELEAFFTTLCGEAKESEPEKQGKELLGEDILQEYSGRWSVEIVIREAKQFGGLGKDQCRRLHRIEGANAFRLFMLAAGRLYFAKQVTEHGEMDLASERPWYKQDVPSGRDVLWNCRAQLLAEGVTPTVGFKHTMEVFHQKQPTTRSRAA